MEPFGGGFLKITPATKSIETITYMTTTAQIATVIILPESSKF